MSNAESPAPSSAKSAQKRRRYASRLRDEQAAATRERVLAAAAEVFAERGFAGTSMPEIARRAGVSTETVQAHGPKATLLRAAIDALAFGGDSDTRTRDTELGRRMLAVGSPAAAVETAADVLLQVNATTHGLWLAFSEASRTDPDIAAGFADLARGVRAQNADLLREWQSRGIVRTDLPFDELVDLSVLASSVEVYDRAVRVDALSPEIYRRRLVQLLSVLITTVPAASAGEP